MIPYDMGTPFCVTRTVAVASAAGAYVLGLLDDGQKKESTYVIYICQNLHRRFIIQRANEHTRRGNSTRGG